MIKTQPPSQPDRFRSSACAASISRTLATRSASGTDTCATRASRHAGIVGDLAGEALAFDQVLDLDDALRAFVAALDDGQRRAAAVGIFQLVAEILLVALVHFGADAGMAQVPG